MLPGVRCSRSAQRDESGRPTPPNCLEEAPRDALGHTTRAGGEPSEYPLRIGIAAWRSSRPGCEGKSRRTTPRTPRRRTTRTLGRSCRASPKDTLVWHCPRSFDRDPGRPESPGAALAGPPRGSVVGCRPSIAGGVAAAIGRAVVVRAADRLGGGDDDAAVHLRQIITVELVDRLTGEAQALDVLFHDLSFWAWCPVVSRRRRGLRP